MLESAEVLIVWTATSVRQAPRLKSVHLSRRRQAIRIHTLPRIHCGGPEGCCTATCLESVPPGPSAVKMYPSADGDVMGSPSGELEDATGPIPGSMWMRVPARSAPLTCQNSLQTCPTGAALNISILGGRRISTVACDVTIFPAAPVTVSVYVVFSLGVTFRLSIGLTEPMSLSMAAESMSPVTFHRRVAAPPPKISDLSLPKAAILTGVLRDGATVTVTFSIAGAPRPVAVIV